MLNNFSDYRKIIETSAEIERCHRSVYEEFKEIILKNIRGICLEVGCGDGIWTSILKDRCKMLVSFDLSEYRVKNVYKTNPSIKFVVCDARRLPFKENIFNTVVALEVIEHLPATKDHIKFLSEVKRVLSPSGRFLISTPNRPIYRLYKKITKDRDLTHFSELSYYQFKRILKDFFPSVVIYGKFGWISFLYKLPLVRRIHRLLSRLVPICKGLLAVCAKK